MALPKLFERIFWHNNTTPDINEDNLNAMSKAIDDIDDRIIDIAADTALAVAQCNTDATNAANSATTAANAATTATNKASEAANSATYAANAATTATNKASEASGYATTATNKANEASGYATSASNSGLKAEGYAVGKQNGTNVGSGSEYYHNNAKYYKEQAADSATSAASSASQAAAWSANPPYIGNNGNWYVYDVTTSAYVDSGIDASITITVGQTTTLTPSSPASVENVGTNTDPIFNFGIPKGETGETGATPNITITATADAVSSDNPSVTVTKGGTLAAPTFALGFSGLKGTKGDTGNTGATGATPQISASATVDSNVGTPGVQVTKSGTDEQPSFTFAFSNIKGETGNTGQTGATGATPNITATATVDSNVGTPGVNVTKSGTAENPSLAFAFSNLKGADGANGTDGDDGISPGVTITTITGGHRVTITDAEHPNGQSFDVMDGAGAGDMLASVYDPDGDVATAGGIVEYIDDVITDALTASY